MKHLFFTAWIMGALLFGPTLAGARVTVETMAPEELDRLISAAKGRRVMAVMTHWCVPCREELPQLVKLYRQYRDQGFVLLGISLDTDVSLMQPITDKARVNFPVYCVGEDPVQKYNITAVPLMFFVKDGQITERLVGQQPVKVLEEKIRKFLE
jgi:thiol-disulfide isomerase/thioredoxin